MPDADRAQALRRSGRASCPAWMKTFAWLGRGGAGNGPAPSRFERLERLTKPLGSVRRSRCAARHRRLADRRARLDHPPPRGIVRRSERGFGGRGPARPPDPAPLRGGTARGGMGPVTSPEMTARKVMGDLKHPNALHPLPRHPRTRSGDPCRKMGWRHVGAQDEHPRPQECLITPLGPVRRFGVSLDALGACPMAGRERDGDDAPEPGARRPYARHVVTPPSRAPLHAPHRVPNRVPNRVPCGEAPCVARRRSRARSPTAARTS